MLPPASDGGSVYRSGWALFMVHADRGGCGVYSSARHLCLNALVLCHALVLSNNDKGLKGKIYLDECAKIMSREC